MCTHYSEKVSDYAEAARRIRVRVEQEREVRDRYNISPKQETAVLKADGGTLMRWGWNRPWTKMLLVNAKAEEAATKKTWQQAFGNPGSRIIMPAGHYYEFPQKGMAIAVRHADQSPLLIAGLWEEHAEEGPCAVMLTTAPNAQVAAIHHRMPAILTAEEARAWLNGAALPFTPYAGALEHFRVSPDAGNWRCDGPYLLEPLAA